MNKEDYITLLGFSFCTFIFVWKWKEKKRDKLFEEEIYNLKNAVDFAINKFGK